jgi:hypothetical protein
MGSFKKLSKSDVTVVPYHANKQWIFSNSNSSTYSSIYQGTNVIGSFVSSSDPISNGQYERLVYTQINQLFYQSYSGSLNTSSLANSIYYESASKNRPTSSYFIYNDNARLVKNFPTGTGETIQVLAINQDIFGNKILPYSFRISSSNYSVVDDGYGNLIGAKTSVVGKYINDGYFNATDYFLSSSNENTSSYYVGNIFYSQGLCIITSQTASYQQIFSFEEYAVSFKNEHIIYEHEVRCAVKESDFNLSYNPTLVNNYASGSVKDFATGSSFYTYATALGLYNDNNELLAIAKFGKPMLISPDTDMTFVVKHDT